MPMVDIVIWCCFTDNSQEDQLSRTSIPNGVSLCIFPLQDCIATDLAFNGAKFNKIQENTYYREQIKPKFLKCAASVLL